MKVLYADDHWITRSAAKHLIERLEPNSNLLEAADFRQALEIACGNPDLDLILLDLLMPGMKRFEGLRAMRECLPQRSEEHTSELQSLMRTSYAVFCLKTKKKTH